MGLVANLRREGKFAEPGVSLAPRSVSSLSRSSLRRFSSHLATGSNGNVALIEPLRSSGSSMAPLRSKSTTTPIQRIHWRQARAPTGITRKWRARLRDTRGEGFDVLAHAVFRNDIFREVSRWPQAATVPVESAAVDPKEIEPCERSTIRMTTDGYRRAEGTSYRRERIPRGD